jgi:NitT/TauT family transport system substrate-binding protein
MLLVRGLVTLVLLVSVSACSDSSSDNMVRIPLGAGGVGFLPLQMMREFNLIEKHAQAAGVDNIEVQWIELGGPAVMNDALLSGSVDFIAAGPPAFLTLWDRTQGSADVHGVAAIASLPMYLNTRAEHLNSLEDLVETDRIAVTAIKVSIPALVMQMYALDQYGIDAVEQFDKFTVTMRHPDGVVAMLSGSSEINSHFTSPPFHQRETEDPAIRTIMSSNDVMGGATTFTMLSTTRAFHDSKPDVYGAVLDALQEAQAMIEADPENAADVLVAAGQGGGFSVAEITEVLADPDIAFSSTPQNTMRYANFMVEVGSMGNRPDEWKSLFFPEIHELSGN